MDRCFCPCHTHPGTYPPPCGVCGHDTREGRMVGGYRDGWESNAPKRMTHQEWQTLKVQDFERMEEQLADATATLQNIRAVLADESLTEEEALEAIRIVLDGGHVHVIRGSRTGAPIVIVHECGSDCDRRPVAGEE